MKMPQVSFLSTIRSITARTSASNDKSLKLTLELTEPELIKAKAAQFLMLIPPDQNIKITVDTDQAP
jgi:hypothetical protein